MFPKKNHEPLTIIVSADRWDAIGELTTRNKWLYSVLEKQGGINESVPPGTYHYNVKRRGFRLEVSLTPANA